MITFTVNVGSAERARELDGVLAAMGFEDYSIEGLDAAARADRVARINGLTGFEREVFEHLGEGRDLARTAAAMAVSRTTVARIAGDLAIRLGLGSVDEGIAVARGAS